MRLHAPSPFHACQVLAGPMSGGDGEPKARSPKWLISCSADATATTLLQTSASAASITAQPTPVGGHVLPPSCACPCGAPCCVPVQRRRDRGKPRRGLIRASCILPSFLPSSFSVALVHSAHSTIEYPSSDCRRAHRFRQKEEDVIGWQP